MTDSMDGASITPARLDAFIRLSALLLDVDSARLDRRVARAFYALVERNTPHAYSPGDTWAGSDDRVPPNPSTLDALFDSFDRLESEGTAGLYARVVSVMYADVGLSGACMNILRAWYLGQIGSDVAPAFTYAHARVWSVIGGNPPGIPGPYYGNWSYPPTTPILPPKGS